MDSFPKNVKLLSTQRFIPGGRSSGNFGNFNLALHVNDNKEMTSRLKVPYDVLSDEKLKLTDELNIPTFSVSSNIFLKRITLIVEKKIIKKVFYPINNINKHIEEVLKWLKEN